MQHNIPLRNFFMKERIRNSCVQRYHQTLQENTKLSKTEHQRKQKAGLSDTTKEEMGSWEMV